jgi:hypothetical protein
VDGCSPPFVLMGTQDEIVAAVDRHEQRWGITRFVVREDAVQSLAPLMPRLSDNS